MTMNQEEPWMTYIYIYILPLQPHMCIGTYTYKYILVNQRALMHLKKHNLK